MRLRHTTRRQQQCPVVEALECRALLSTVSVDFTDGDLVLIGDSGDNFVGLYLDGNQDIVVGGFGGTKLTVPEAPGFEFETVLLEKAFIPDDVRMKFNKGGDNLVIFEQISIGDDVSYVGGKQNDLFGINDSNLGGTMTLKTGNGDDIIAVKETDITGSLKINTGNDDDKIGLDEAFIDQDLIIASGKGDDQIGILDSSVGDDATFKTGSGNDAIFMYFTNVTDKVKAALGSGNDDIVIDTSTVGPTSVNGGSGFDAVEFCDVTSPTTPVAKAAESDDMENEGDRAIALQECIADAIDLD